MTFVWILMTAEVLAGIYFGFTGRNIMAAGCFFSLAYTAHFMVIQ